MRIADITTPGDYEVQYKGNRVTIVAVETRTRQVYSGERWDFHGHEGTSKMAVDDKGRLYTPQQVLRPWAAAQSSNDRETLSKNLQNDAIRTLRTALGERIKSVQAETSWDGHTRYLHSISVTLTVAQAVELAAALGERS